MTTEFHTADELFAEYDARRDRVRASLIAHLEAPSNAAGLTAALEWLDHLAKWDVDAEFPFPTDGCGNPIPNTSEWRDWSWASGDRDLLEAAALLLRSVLTATASEPTC